MNPRPLRSPRALWAAVLLATTALAQGDAFVLRGGRVHARPGTVLPDADVVVENDLIKAVGKGVPIPDGATIIDLAGEDLYAGFIDPLNTGLLDAGHAAGGPSAGNPPALDGFERFLNVYNHELLRGGVLTVGLGCAPSGINAPIVSVLAVEPGPGEPSVIARNQFIPCVITALVPQGRVSTVLLREAAAKAIEGWLDAAKAYGEALEKYQKDFAEYEKKLAEWEKTKGSDSRSASRPSADPAPAPPPTPVTRPPGGGMRRRGRGGDAPPEVRPAGPAAAPSSTSGSSRPKAPTKPAVQPAKETLGRVLKREVPLWIEASWVTDIDAALAIAKKRDIRIVLAGASEALRRIDAIKDARIVVALPSSASTDPDSLDRALEPAGLCAALARAGIPVTFYTAGDGVVGPAGLPLAAALGIGCGMTEEQALAAVTVNAARAVGLSKVLGTIEPGKVASLFSCRGSPFKPDARVLRAWVRGKPVEWGSN